MVILVGSVLVLSNCKDPKDAADPMKVQLGKLSKTWTMISPNGAIYDGTDDRSTPEFTGFTLTLSGTFSSSSPEGPYSYSVGGSRQEPSPWPTSGEWSFNSVDKGSDSGTIVRSDDVPMTYNINSSGQLVITFTCPEGVCNYLGAKTVEGTWQFTFQ